MADNGLYTHTFNYEKKENCSTCGTGVFTVTINPDTTLANFRLRLKEYPDLQLSDEETALQSLLAQLAA